MRATARQVNSSMTIGKLSKATGVSVDAIRFYERSALLPKAARTASGYREYGLEDQARLAFVVRARGLGFSLEEISELLALRIRRDGGVAKVRLLARKKLAVVQSKIDELAKLRSALMALVEACPGSGEPGNCPILNAFGGTTAHG